MTPRSIRRAAERKAFKKARQAEKLHPIETTTEIAAAADPTTADPTTAEPTAHEEPRPISSARVAANQANAQSSTGPRTAEGKAKSSHNALKTGLTGHTILLPIDDVAAYQRHIARFFAKYSPANDDEKTLVQSTADTNWRLLRIPSLESGIFAIGRHKLAGEFAHEQDPQVRAAMIEAQIAMDYRRDLSNLNLQERRLRNQRAADTAELETMQQKRKADALTEIARASSALETARRVNRPFYPDVLGFDFSIEEIEDFSNLREVQTYLNGGYTRLSEDEIESFVARWRGQDVQKAAA